MVHQASHASLTEPIACYLHWHLLIPRNRIALLDMFSISLTPFEPAHRKKQNKKHIPGSICTRKDPKLAPCPSASDHRPKAHPEAAWLWNATPLPAPHAQRESSNWPKSDRSPVLKQSQSRSPESSGGKHVEKASYNGRDVTTWDRYRIKEDESYDVTINGKYEQHAPNIARVALDPQRAAVPTRNICIMFVASMLPSPCSWVAKMFIFSHDYRDNTLIWL